MGGFVKPMIISILDDNQYGAIPKTSTTTALIGMLHNCFLGTDGNWLTVRTSLFDYGKVFDLIDHGILVRKFCNQCKLPPRIINWITDFLSDRSLHQRVFLNGAQSMPVYHRFTKLRPWLLVLIINDLDTNAQQWEYMDDITLLEVEAKCAVTSRASHS